MLAARDPKKAFGLIVGRFADQESASFLARLKPGSRSPYEVLRRFQVDLRAQSIWEWLNGDETTTVSFLEELTQAFRYFWLVREISLTAFCRSQLHAEAMQAMDALSKSCEKLRQEEDLYSYSPEEEGPRLPEGIEEMLNLARQQIWKKMMRDNEAFGRFLPNSRKAAPEFQKRVHFPCLLVRRMRERFGRPLFQQVADATTVLFGLRKPLSVNSVSKAWLRHGHLVGAPGTPSADSMSSLAVLQTARQWHLVSGPGTPSADSTLHKAPE
jgi:hypothetical protein